MDQSSRPQYLAPFPSNDAEVHYPHHRVRHKLERWNLPGLPRVVADRFLHTIAARCSAACRRCGVRNGVEQMVYCSPVPGAGQPLQLLHVGLRRRSRGQFGTLQQVPPSSQISQAFLRIHEDYLLPLWIGVDSAHKGDDNLLLRAALGAYSVYRTTNAARAHMGISVVEAEGALRQALREAATGHAVAERTVDSTCVL